MRKQRQYKLCYGLFNVESIWNNQRYVDMPSLQKVDNTVSSRVLDELLSLFCEQSDDLLVTRTAIGEPHRHYLSQLGYHFHNLPLDDVYFNPDAGYQSLCSVNLENSRLDQALSNAADRQPILLTYAQLPNTHHFAARYGFVNEFPNYDTVEKVNAKPYAANLRENLGTPLGKVCRSQKALQDYCNEQLSAGISVVVKSAFGVSGSGNIRVDSPTYLQALNRHISRQKDRLFTLIAEPLLDRKMDFSCQFFIDTQGNPGSFSLQRLFNQSGSFASIRPLNQQERALIDEQTYFDYMNSIALALFAEGYFGPVCVDSMITRQNQLIPLIEINARYSMGFFNNLITRRIQPNQYSELLSYQLKSDRHIYYETFLSCLKRHNLLYGVNAEEGVFPLTSNSFPTHENSGIDLNKRSRFVFSIIASSAESALAIKQTFHALLKEMEIKIL